MMGGGKKKERREKIKKITGQQWVSLGRSRPKTLLGD
jgi:hypothetical protein